MTSRLPIPGWLLWLLAPIWIWAIPVVTVQHTCEKIRGCAKSTRKAITKRIHRRRHQRLHQRGDILLQESRPKATKQNQLRSTFLRLPFEIRQQIYDLVLAPATFTIHEVNTTKCQYKLAATATIHWYVHDKRNPDPKSNVVIKGGILDIPLSCRHLYGEGIQHIYARNTFRLENFELCRLLPSYYVFSRSQLDCLKRLELQFEAMDIVKYFNLRDFRFDPQSAIQLRRLATPNNRRRTKWAALWAFLSQLPQLHTLRVEFLRIVREGSIKRESEVHDWILHPVSRSDHLDRLSVFNVSWSGLYKGRADRLEEEWFTTVPFPQR